jgi:hypothetical protein
MALTTPLPGVPESRIYLGIGNTIDAKQVIPGTSDYVAGGYPLPALQFDLTRISQAEVVAQNSTAAQYQTALLFPSTYFPATGIVAAPTSINFQVLQPASASAGQPIADGTVATATLSALTSNVATVTAANTFVAGQFVALAGFANAAATVFNGRVVQITVATATTYKFNLTHANITSGADAAGTATLLTSTNGPLTTLTPITSTNSASTSDVATITIANTFQPGQFVVLQGFSNAGATAYNGYVVQIITASSTQFTFNFYHADIVSEADTGTAALLVTPGGAPITTSTTFTISNSALTSNVASISAVNTLVPGNIVVLQGLTNAATLNGQLAVVIATGLTNALFEADITATNIASEADAGTAALLVAGSAPGYAEVPVGTNLSGAAWSVRVIGV